MPPRKKSGRGLKGNAIALTQRYPEADEAHSDDESGEGSQGEEGEKNEEVEEAEDPVSS